MSLLEILKLVAFATGSVLYFYFAWLLWNRRARAETSKPGVSILDSESTFIMLALCMTAWFFGNLLNALHVLLLGQGRQIAWLRVWDTITVIGIALFPSAMLHSHAAFWSWLDGYRWIKPAQARRLIAALYVPMIFLPYTVYRVNTGPYRPYLGRLKPLLLPYSVWFLLALWSSGAIDWWMKDRLPRSAIRERAFLKRFAVMLFALGAFEFVVVGLRRSVPNDALWVIYVLLSLLPPITAAYYIYRYHPFQLVIKGSLVYAAFAVIFIAVYTYGVRHLGDFLAQILAAPPVVVEAILLLGLVALAGPLVRVMDKTVQRLFTREIGLYRDVVRQVSTGVAGFGDINSLVDYAEETIRRGLDLSHVRIVPLETVNPDSSERRLAEKFNHWQAAVINDDEDLVKLGGTAAYALKREGRLIGLMIITAEPRTLTSEKHAVLEVLSGQVAIALESCRLVEEKVRLERELASRERLAMLGQMAATVAHEVKNPLSAVKSIAQVMREDAELSGYQSDLSLIISEIDRLNRSVSQLLAFSRPAREEGAALSRDVSLRELVDSTVALASSDARAGSVQIIAEVAEDVLLSGAQATALREALSNLVINAVQAMTGDGRVTVRANVTEGEAATGSAAPLISAADASPAIRAERRMLIVSVTDEGRGIPEESQRRVFEPFYTTKPRGTGLGLAIVQRRAVELGGAVELTSPVVDGRGTRFRLMVPLAGTAKRPPRIP